MSPEEGLHKLEAMRQAEAQRRAALRALCPFFGPRAGNCVICGKHMGAYWNKCIERDTGRLACEDHGLAWDHYSDG